MAPPARDEKRGFSETLDTRSRVQKPVTKASRTQSLAAIFTGSVSKINAAVEKTAETQVAQAVASPSEEPLYPMNIEIESETEDLPPLPTSTLNHTTANPQTQTEDTVQTQSNPKIYSCQKTSTLMTKTRGLLNLIGSFLEEMKLECPGAGADFLALISDWVSRAIRGESIYVKNPVEPENQSFTQEGKKFLGYKGGRRAEKSARNSRRGPPARPTPPKDKVTKTDE